MRFVHLTLAASSSYVFGSRIKSMEMAWWTHVLGELKTRNMARDAFSFSVVGLVALKDDVYIYMLYEILTDVGMYVCACV